MIPKSPGPSSALLPTSAKSSPFPFPSSPLLHLMHPLGGLIGTMAPGLWPWPCQCRRSESPKVFLPGSLPRPIFWLRTLTLPSGATSSPRLAFATPHPPLPRRLHPVKTLTSRLLCMTGPIPGWPLPRTIWSKTPTVPPTSYHLGTPSIAPGCSCPSPADPPPQQQPCGHHRRSARPLWRPSLPPRPS